MLNKLIYLMCKQNANIKYATRHHIFPISYSNMTHSFDNYIRAKYTGNCVILHRNACFCDKWRPQNIFII